MGRPLLPLSIKAEDQLHLLAWTRRPKTSQALAMRPLRLLPGGAIQFPGGTCTHC